MLIKNLIWAPLPFVKKISYYLYMNIISSQQGSNTNKPVAISQNDRQYNILYLSIHIKLIYSCCIVE